jgi:hypothetical protein
MTPNNDPAMEAALEIIQDLGASTEDHARVAAIIRQHYPQPSRAVIEQAVERMAFAHKMARHNPYYLKQCHDETESALTALRAQLNAPGEPTDSDDTAIVDWLLKQGLCWRGCDTEITSEHWRVGHGTEWLYRSGGGRDRIRAAMLQQAKKEATP